MKNTLSLLLLLLVLLTDGPGGSPSPVLAQLCPANLTISGPEGVIKITTDIFRVEDLVHIMKKQYVRPKQGFKGVSVVVNGGTAAWFPLEDICFPDGDEWWQVLVTARLADYRNTTISGLRGYQQLKYQVRTSACIRVCYKNGIFSSIQSVQVLGHGTSEWRTDPTDERCGNITEWMQGTYQGKFPSCMDLSPPRISTTTHISIWVTVVGIIAVLVLVHYVRKRRCGDLFGELVAAVADE